MAAARITKHAFDCLHVSKQVCLHTNLLRCPVWLPQECTPLELTAPNGTKFAFRGVDALFKGAVDTSSLLTPPDAVGDASASLSAGQLANQALLRVRQLVAEYYDGWLVSDDEMAPVNTRNVCLRPVIADDGRPVAAQWGAAHPDTRATGAHVRRQLTEQQLYTQLSYYYRLFDVEGGLKRLKKEDDRRKARDAVTPLAGALAAAADAVATVRDRSKYRWVSLGGIFGSSTGSGTLSSKTA